MRRHHEAVTGAGLNALLLLGGLYVPVVIHKITELVKGKGK